jgi:hypothetical protein
VRVFKQIIFIAVIVSAIALGAWSYLYIRNNKKPATLALTALPDKCLVYFQTGDFFSLSKKINSQSIVVDQLKSFIEVSELCQSLRIFDSIFESNEFTARLLEKNTIHFAVYRKDTLSWLAACNIKQLGKSEDAVIQLRSIFKAGESSGEIYGFNKGGKSCWFAIHDGIVIMSDSEELLKRSMQSGSRLQDDPEFSKYSETLSANCDLSVYVDHALYSQSKKAGRLNLSALGRQAYSAGNVVVEPAMISVNGFYRAPEEDAISALQNEKPQSPALLNDILPLNTISFRAMAFSSYGAVLKKANIHLKGSRERKFWSGVNEKGMFNVEKAFFDNALDQLVQFRTNGGEFTCLKIADTVASREQLLFMSDSVLPSANGVYSLRHAPPLFDPFASLSTRYAARQGTHLYFAEDSLALGQLMAMLKSKMFLSQNQDFMTYAGHQFPDEYNLLIYASPAVTREDLPLVFNFKRIDSEPDKSFRHFSYSLVNGREDFRFRMNVLNQSASSGGEPDLLWTQVLDTVADFQPRGFLNHVTGAGELLIQDQANTLYLLNAKGGIIWRKKIGGRIVSGIAAVDAFRNNKLQMIFNTSTDIYLIDRLGRDVEGYPVKLPSPASGALSVFDYEGTKDYRVMVPCEDRMIYNFNINGKRQEGFVPVKTGGTVKLPVQFVRIAGNDFLVAVDVEGKIYCFNRKGAPRLSLKNRTVSECRGFYIDGSTSLSNSWIYYFDDGNASIQKISLADQKEIVRLHEETVNSASKFRQVDDNRQMDLVMAPGERAVAFSLTGNRLFEKDVPYHLDEVDYFSDESHSLFCGINREKNELLIYDTRAQTAKTKRATALPALLDLFNNQKKYMVVLDGAQVNCFFTR